MCLKARAMIRDPVLREVIGTDTLRAIHGAHLGEALSRGLGLLLRSRLRGQARCKHAQGSFFVLQLRFLILHRHDDAGGQVGDANGRIRRVHGLPAGAARPIHVDTQVVRVDDDLLVVLDLRHHEHADGTRVDATLGLGHGNALHAVHAALVLQVSPHALIGSWRALRADRQGDVFEATELRMGRAHLGHAPTVRLGVATVHARQIGCEERGLFAALAGLDLKNDIHRVLRITRGQDLDEGLVGSRFLFFEGGNLVGEGSVFGRELTRGLEISRGSSEPICGGLHTTKFGVAASHAAHQLRVRQRLGIRHLRLDLLVFLQQRAQGAELVRRGHYSPHPSIRTVDKAAAPSAMGPTTPPLS